MSFLQVESLEIEAFDFGHVLRLQSADGMNRLTRNCMPELADAIDRLAKAKLPLVIAGNARYFSVGADLNEVSRLSASEAHEFSAMGQALMNQIADFPAPVLAVIEGHCMGGGLDLALACHCRIASPHATFGHRGAALGLVTGWGGTQRLPRLVGKSRALQMFVTAEGLDAEHALRIGLIDVISDQPETRAAMRLRIGAIRGPGVLDRDP